MSLKEREYMCACERDDLINASLPHLIINLKWAGTMLDFAHHFVLNVSNEC